MFYFRNSYLQFAPVNLKMGQSSEISKSLVLIFSQKKNKRERWIEIIKHSKLTGFGNSVPQSPSTFRMTTIVSAEFRIIVVYTAVLCKVAVPVQMVWKGPVPGHVANDGSAYWRFRLALRVSIAKVAAGSGATSLQTLGRMLADVRAHSVAGPHVGPAACIAPPFWCWPLSIFSAGIQI